MKKFEQNKETEPVAEVIFEYSIQSEINRLKWTLDRYEWYKENGYKIKLPELISEKLKTGEKIVSKDNYLPETKKIKGLKKGER